MAWVTDGRPSLASDDPPKKTLKRLAKLNQKENALRVTDLKKAKQNHPTEHCTEGRIR
jgi:hypothetical protein